MPIDPRALFPDEIAADLLELVGGAEALAPELPAVRTAVATVRGMLADQVEVAAVISRWRDAALARLVESEDLIRDARTGLEPAWQGPAFRAYAAHEARVRMRIGEIRVAVTAAGTALTGLLAESTARYRSAVESLVTVASDLVRLAGPGPAPVPVESAGPALVAIGRFLAEVATGAHEAGLAMAGFTDMFRRISTTLDRPAGAARPAPGWPGLPQPPAHGG